ncbi:MAG TPA: S49 family peptidase [Xanthobacteraceae bacterium]|nr:S49 family peptidase [Xanthobacteraceae bacterium]
MLDLPHVASRLFGTPLMIARAKLEAILGVLTPRLAGNAIEPTEGPPEPAPLTALTAERIAVISVIGTLVARSGYLDAASGLRSYSEIGAVIADAMADASVRGVILDVDSAGGEVGGLFDLVDRVRALRAASDKPLWAVANESALSAAYAIASAADRVYVTRTGEVGSIGVVAVHVDESGADAKAGLAWTFIFAGEHKIDANPHAPLSERARSDIQADVDRLYAELCSLIAFNRGLTVETVRATEAAIYRGALAVRAGLADRLGTLDLAIAEMATELDRTAPARALINPTLKRSLSMATNETEQFQDQPHEPQPAVTQAAPDPAPTPAPASTAPEASAAERLRAEFAEVAAIAAQAARLGVEVDAADALKKGITPDALRRSVLDTLAARAEATSVIAAAPPSAAANDSPIVRRAKERAAAAARP